MTPKQTAKKIRTYFDKGMRHLKHRKGFGVHSPFAYNLITEVIEEKTAYYAYPVLNQIFTKSAPVKIKVGMLLLRLANRFSCRVFLDLSRDGGFSAIPFVFTDKRNMVTCLTNKEEEARTLEKLSEVKNPFYKNRESQVRFISDIAALPDDFIYDMVAMNEIPQGFSDAADFHNWLKKHSHPNTVFWVKGIRGKQPMETVWDLLCDDEEIEVTMDLYEYGLAMRRPRFFKQHYIVSF